MNTPNLDHFNVELQLFESFARNRLLDPVIKCQMFFKRCVQLRIGLELSECFTLPEHAYNSNANSFRGSQSQTLHKKEESELMQNQLSEAQIFRNAVPLKHFLLVQVLSMF